MVLLGRSRLPSFEVQRETRAILAAAMSEKRLPASISEIDGFIVTEKNTFIYITDASDSSLICDVDLANDDCSPIPLTTGFPEGSAVSSQIPTRQRGLSVSVGLTRWRRRSCPPRVLQSEQALGSDYKVSDPMVQFLPETPVSRLRNRRHYSVDCSQQSSPVRTSPSCCSLKPVDESSASTLPSTPTDPVMSRGKKTTVMLRNVPYGESQLGVLNLVEQRGFGGRFDFFYAPLDFSSGNNLGYAFINLPEPSAVSEFFTVFDGLRVDKEGWSQKDLQVCWARVQGRHPNVEHYRNSPVNDMPENFRPMIFDDEGKQLPFPRPDENVPRRPIPATSMYSGGHRGVGRPRFASAHIPGSTLSGNTASRRRSGGLGGSFHARP